MKTVAIAMALALAEDGVRWIKGKGAFCPACGEKMRVKSTRKELRYCCCESTTCVLGMLKIGIKALP